MTTYRKDRLKEIFEQLLRSDGASKNEKNTVAVVQSILSDLPVNIVQTASKSKTRPNLYIKLPKRGATSSPPILLSAHMDTVEPTPNICFTCQNEQYTTDGNTILGSDDKAGVAAIIECLFSVHESNKPHPDIEVAFTVEEEIGLEGAKDFDTSLIQAKQGIVIDADGDPGIIMYAGPSQVVFEVNIQGKSAHAGMSPEEGKSAILFASECISKIPFGRIDSETTTNIGKIEGGKATNIVAEHCFLNGEIRSHNPSKLEIVKHQIKSIFEKGSLYGYKIQFKDHYAYKSFSFRQDTSIIRKISTAMETIGLDPELKVCGGGCDANVFNETIPSMECVNLACGMTDVHTHKESIYFSDIEKITELLIQVCTMEG